MLGSWRTPHQGRRGARSRRLHHIYLRKPSEEDETRHDSDRTDEMAITDYAPRPNSYALTSLEDRFEVIKEIGDGSFGSVALARVRANGASVARRNSMVYHPNPSLPKCH